MAARVAGRAHPRTVSDATNRGAARLARIDLPMRDRCEDAVLYRADGGNAACNPASVHRV